MIFTFKKSIIKTSKKIYSKNLSKSFWLSKEKLCLMMVIKKSKQKESIKLSKDLRKAIKSLKKPKSYG